MFWFRFILFFFYILIIYIFIFLNKEIAEVFLMRHKNQNVTKKKERAY